MQGFDSFFNLFQRDDDSGTQLIAAKSKTKLKIKLDSLNQPENYLLEGYRDVVS